MIFRQSSSLASRLVTAALAAAVTVLSGSFAMADGVNLSRRIDSNNYDPQKSTATAAAEVLFMLGDTLVSLDYDMTSLHPGLAKSWDVSADGLTYTFHLRDDVKFCDGRAMTADDVAYSFNRWINPATKSPVAWRAGEVDSITATDKDTVSYKLKKPFSELLYQLTQSFAIVIDKNTVEKLGDNFGVSGFNGTGPFCWGEWRPRDKMVLNRNPAYTWGPEIYANRGPAKVDSVTWSIIGEENTLTAALMTGQTDASNYVPPIALQQFSTMPGFVSSTSKSARYTYFLGFKLDKQTVKDLAVRQAINYAVDRVALVQDQMYGTVTPAYSYITEDTLDWNPDVDKVLIKDFDPEKAKTLLDQDGWKVGSDGIREKNGVKLAPVLYSFNGAWTNIDQDIQAELLKVGINLQIQVFDATVAWGKLATQEFDMFTMGYPYFSAGDAMNLYFRSGNTPAPNRTNWKDPETDALLASGSAATSNAERAKDFGKVLYKVHDAVNWLPLYHAPIIIVQTDKLKPMKAHPIYGAAFYKGLDLEFVK
ncbi:MAG: ABC transporter substrate-binding protein [Neorhizobium sp.]|nr:ABC transporter substrate-binding protein [Neorhizobium sp.]